MIEINRFGYFWLDTWVLARRAAQKQHPHHRAEAQIRFMAQQQRFRHRCQLPAGSLQLSHLDAGTADRALVRNVQNRWRLYRGAYC